LLPTLLVLACAVRAPAAYDEYVWDGSDSTDWTTAANWGGSSNALSGGTYDIRLNVLNGAGSPLYYTAAQGTTVYATSSGTGKANPRSLVIGNGTVGAMFITGGSFESRGAQDDLVGHNVAGRLVLADTGQYVKTNGTSTVIGNAGGGRGLLEISNGVATIRSIINNRSASWGTVILAGGTLELGQLTRTGTGSGTLTNLFEGGLLKATTSTTAWVSTEAVNLVGASGALFDTAGFNVTFGGALLSNSVAGGVTKSGVGTLTLGGANTYRGDTMINAGILRFDSAGSIGGAGESVMVNAGAVVAAGYAIDQALLGRITDGSTGIVALAASSANDLDLSAAGLSNVYLGAVGNVALSGTLTPYGAVYRLGGAGGTLTNAGVLSGAGNQVLIGAPGSLGVVVLAAANTFGGDTTVGSAGKLVLQDNNALGSSTGLTVVSGAWVGVAAGITAGAGVTAGISGNGGDNIGALRSVGGDATWAGAVRLAANASRLGAAAGASLIVEGVIDDGPNAYTVEFRSADNAGVVVLEGANTYGGQSSVIVGGLRIGGAADRLPVGSVLSIGNGNNVGAAWFDLGGYNQTVAGLTHSGGTMPVWITNSSATASTLTVDQADTRTFRGRIDGNVDLVKDGAGVLLLTGVNASTGSVRVAGGTLELSGSGSLAAGTVRIDVGAQFVATNLTGGTLHLATNQTLGGGGTFVGGLVADAGSAIEPGSSAGVLTMAGALTLQAGSTFRVELDGYDAGILYDQLAMGGQPLTVNGATLDVVFGFTPTNGAVFQIVSGLPSSTLPGTFDTRPEDSVFSSGGTDVRINYTSSDIRLTVVPEPSTMGALLLGAAALAFRRRRR
jgi:autotransporter-associated beta strand protein